MHIHLCTVESRAKKNQSVDHTKQMPLHYHILGNSSIFFPFLPPPPRDLGAHLKAIACQICFKSVAKFDIPEA